MGFDLVVFESSIDSCTDADQLPFKCELMRIKVDFDVDVCNFQHSNILFWLYAHFNEPHFHNFRNTTKPHTTLIEMSWQ